MGKNSPQTPWARYADDGLVHCQSEKEAEQLLQRLKGRFAECGLELHPDKTRIIYCKDEDRKEEHREIKFDFLGYTFRPRRARNWRGKYFVSFLSAISNKAAKSLRREIHDWRMHLKPDRSIEDLSRMFNPIIRGWINYYGRFYQSRLYAVLRYLNRSLVHWVRRKYKRYENHRRNAEHWLSRVARRERRLFAHWQMGIVPSAGMMGSRMSREVPVRFCERLRGKFPRSTHLVIICGHKSQARQALREVEAILKRLKLMLHPEKTRLVTMTSEGFDFLGFHFRKNRARRSGKMVPFAWPSKKVMKRICGLLKEWTTVRWLKLSLMEIVKKLNEIISGWRNYFSFGNGTRKFQILDRYVRARLLRFYRRRIGPRGKKVKCRFEHWYEHCGIESFYRKGIFGRLPVNAHDECCRKAV